MVFSEKCQWALLQRLFLNTETDATLREVSIVEGRWYRHGCFERTGIDVKIQKQTRLDEAACGISGQVPINLMQFRPLRLLSGRMLPIGRSPVGTFPLGIFPFIGILPCRGHLCQEIRAGQILRRSGL